jgi:hypothetical protein
MHRLGRHLQLVLHVQRAGRDEGVDARAGRELDRRAGPVDVLGRRPGQSRDGAVLDPLGDLADRLEVALGGDREAGFDHVDAHLLEDVGDLQLLLQVHGAAGRLLAVAHGGVEDDDALARTRGIAGARTDARFLGVLGFCRHGLGSLGSPVNRMFGSRSITPARLPRLRL